MLKLLRWAFWNAVYGVRPRPYWLKDWITRHQRTAWPWRKFKPYVFHNDAGRQWDICLRPEPAYTTRATLQVECDFDQETGVVTGFTVWDEVLNRAAEAQREELRRLTACKTCAGTGVTWSNNAIEAGQGVTVPCPDCAPK